MTYLIETKMKLSSDCDRQYLGYAILIFKRKTNKENKYNRIKVIFPVVFRKIARHKNDMNGTE